MDGWSAKGKVLRPNHRAHSVPTFSSYVVTHRNLEAKNLDGKKALIFATDVIQRNMANLPHKPLGRHDAHTESYLLFTSSCLGFFPAVWLNQGGSFPLLSYPLIAGRVPVPA